MRGDIPHAGIGRETWIIAEGDGSNGGEGWTHPSSPHGQMAKQLLSLSVVVGLIQFRYLLDQFPDKPGKAEFPGNLELSISANRVSKLLAVGRADSKNALIMLNALLPGIGGFQRIHGERHVSYKRNGLFVRFISDREVRLPRHQVV